MSKSKTILRLSLTDIREIHNTIIENHAIISSEKSEYKEQLNTLLNALVILFLDISDRFRKMRGLSESDKEYLNRAIPEVKRIFHLLEQSRNALEAIVNPLPPEECVVTINPVSAKKLENLGHRVILKISRGSKTRFHSFKVENTSARLLYIEDNINPLPSPEVIVTRSETLATKLRKLGHPVLLSKS